jgi:hypothetical protein
VPREIYSGIQYFAQPTYCITERCLGVSAVFRQRFTFGLNIVPLIIFEKNSKVGRNFSSIKEAASADQQKFPAPPQPFGALESKQKNPTRSVSAFFGDGGLCISSSFLRRALACFDFASRPLFLALSSVRFSLEWEARLLGFLVLVISTSRETSVCWVDHGYKSSTILRAFSNTSSTASSV